MSQVARAILLAIFILSTSVWVGGYVAIAVVARAATAALDPRDRVALFRSLGRSYVRVGVLALVIALASGAILLRDHPLDALVVVTVAVVAALVALLATAVVQARRMTGLRRRLLVASDDERLVLQVRRGSRVAGAMRAALGLLTLTLVLLGSFLAV